MGGMSVVGGAEDRWSTWRHALLMREKFDTPAADVAEQRAYDALIDYVEAHGLNHSEWDPRP